MKLTRRAFLGLLALGGAASCTRTRAMLGMGADAPFTVAALGDLHITDARSAAIVNRAVKAINATPGVRFVAVLGDLSAQGAFAELSLAKSSLDRLTAPYYAIPGNHDVEPNAPNPYGNYEKLFARGNWVLEEGRWAFLGLDSCEGAASDVSIRPDRIEWLRKRIAHLGKNRPLGLFTHHPLAPGAREYRVKNADEVLGLFAGHNLKLAAAGHWHGNQEESRDGVLFTTTACCSSTRDNFDGAPAKGYRLFRFQPDTVETEFVAV